MSNDAITDRMIVLGRELNHGRSDKLNGCYARLTPNKEYLRVDKSGKTTFVSQAEFNELDDNAVIASLEADFDNETNPFVNR